MKNKKVEISKINIRIGDKEIPLTLEEAQELRQILDETFGVKERVYHPFFIESPYRRVYPYWYVDYTVSPNTVTYTLTSGSTYPTDPVGMPSS